MTKEIGEYTQETYQDVRWLSIRTDLHSQAQNLLK